MRWLPSARPPRRRRPASCRRHTAALEFEEGFVDRAQFLGLHRAPVDGDHAGLVREPGEAIERFHEGAVAQAGGLQVGQPVLGKEAAERGQRKGGLAMCEGAEDDLHPLVAVMVLVPGGGAVALLAQRLERIALGVKARASGLAFSGWRRFRSSATIRKISR